MSEDTKTQRSAKIVWSLGWVVFGGLMADAIIFHQAEASTVALFVGPCWLAYYFARFTQENERVTDPAGATVVPAALVLAMSILATSQSYWRQNDEVRLRQACNDRVMRQANVAAVCTDALAIFDTVTSDDDQN